MKLNHKNNLVILPTPFHGNHPAYSKYVMEAIDNLGPNATLQDIVSLQNSMRYMIRGIRRGGGYKRMNHYFKDQGY